MFPRIQTVTMSNALEQLKATGTVSFHPAISELMHFPHPATLRSRRVAIAWPAASPRDAQTSHGKETKLPSHIYRMNIPS